MIFLYFDILIKTNFSFEFADDQNVWSYNENSQISIHDVLPNGASDKAGIKENDVLLRINGNEIKNMPDARKYFFQYSNGELIYDILRNGKEIQIKFFPAFRRNMISMLFFLVSLIYFMVGLILFSLKSNSISLRSLYIFFSLSAIYFIISGGFYFLFINLFSNTIIYFAFFAILPSLIRFFKHYPYEDTKTFLSTNWFNFIFIFTLPTLWIIYRVLGTILVHPINREYYILYWVFYFILLIIVLQRKFEFKNEMDKRHYKLIKYSIYASFLPSIILFDLPSIFMQEFFWQHHSYLAYSVLFLVFIPISFLIAIFKYKLLGINLIIEKSIIYFIVSALLIIFYGVIIFVFGKIFFSFTPFTNEITTIIILIIFLQFLQPLKNKVQSFVDKKFFREKYDFKISMNNFLKKLQSTIRKEEIINLLLNELQEILHIDKEFIIEYNITQNKNIIMGKYNLSIEEEEYLISDYIPRVNKKLSDIFEKYSSEDIFHYVRTNKNSIFDVQDFKKHYAIFTNQNNQNIIYAISFGKKLSGVDYLGDDNELIESFLTQILIAFEKSLLFEQIQEQEVVAAELRTAHEVQKKLLPEIVPNNENIEFAARNYPAELVGGDLYNIIEKSKTEYWIVIGDVSGKGLPAAILMSNIQSMVEALINQGDKYPAEIMEVLNESVYKNTDPIHYATMFLAKIDLNAKELIYSNGGHNFPLLVKKNILSMLDEGGIPVGMLPEQKFIQKIEKIESNDILFLYTDGVTDLENPDNEQLGEKKLYDFLRKNKDLALSRLSYELIDYLNEFMKEKSPNDDITFVFAKFK